MRTFGPLVILATAAALLVARRTPASAVAGQPNQPNLQTELNNWTSAAPNWGIELVGVSVVDLGTGQRWSVNGDDQMGFMSSAKFPWTAFAEASAGVDAAAPYADAVFSVSDNYAAGSMIDAAGGLDRINDYFYKVLGMSDSCTQRWDYGTPRSYSGQCSPTSEGPYAAHGIALEDHNSANDMTTFLSHLWHNDIPGLTAQARQALLSWSTEGPSVLDPNGDGTLTGYLPPSVWPAVHHKIGWYWDPYLSASDIGIVETPLTTYAIAIATFNGSSSGAQQDFMASVSCDVYKSLSGDGAWNCGTHNYDAAGGLGLSVGVSNSPNGPFAPVASGTNPVEGGTAYFQVTVSAAVGTLSHINVFSWAPDCQRPVFWVEANQPFSYVCSAGLDTPATIAWAATAAATGGVASSGTVVGRFQDDQASYTADWQVANGFGGPWSPAGPVSYGIGEPRWRLALTNTGGVTLSATATLSADGLAQLACTDQRDATTLSFTVAPHHTREVFCTGSLASSGGLGGLLSVVTSNPNLPSRTLNPQSLPRLQTDRASGSSTAVPTPSAFVPVQPVRILDTRMGPGPVGRLASGHSVTGTIPATAIPSGVDPTTITAAVVNLTATGSDGAGYLTLHAGGTDMPLASTVNFGPGEDSQNLAIVPVSGGAFEITAGGANVDAVVDLTGVFTTQLSAGLRYQPLTPTRVYDSRLVAAGPLNGTRAVPVAGPGLPAPAGTRAVAATLTVTGPASGGFVSAHPTDVWTGTSNVNFTAGDTRANTVLLPVGADGAIRLTSSGPVQVIVDVTGYFDASAGELYVPLGNLRISDTRSYGTGALVPQVARVTAVADSGPDPTAAWLQLPWPVKGAWLNSTVVNPGGEGYALLYPGGPPPWASTQNFMAGQVRANGSAVGLSAQGNASVMSTLLAGSAGADQVLDLTGLFVAA